MDDRRAAFFGLHHPTETDRMTLGHIRALNDDAIRVLQILLKAGCAASTE